MAPCIAACVCPSHPTNLTLCAGIVIYNFNCNLALKDLLEMPEVKKREEGIELVEQSHAKSQLVQNLPGMTPGSVRPQNHLTIPNQDLQFLPAKSGCHGSALKSQNRKGRSFNSCRTVKCFSFLSSALQPDFPFPARNITQMFFCLPSFSFGAMETGWMSSLMTAYPHTTTSWSSPNPPSAMSSGVLSWKRPMQSKWQPAALCHTLLGCRVHSWTALYWTCHMYISSAYLSTFFHRF